MRFSPLRPVKLYSTIWSGGFVFVGQTCLAAGLAVAAVILVGTVALVYVSVSRNRAPTLESWSVDFSTKPRSEMALDDLGSSRS